MSKGSELLANTGILALGQFGSKFLVFFLLPLYTATLSTAEYGAFDLIFGTVTMLVPLLTFNIVEGVSRFALDDDADVAAIARISMGITAASALVVLGGQLMPGLPWSGFLGIGYCAPLYFAYSLLNLLIAFARAENRMKDVALGGIVNTVLTAVLNILLLVVVPMGFDGFMLANIGGMLIAAIFLAVRMRSTLFGVPREGLAPLACRMIRYAWPLTLAILGWWFMSFATRYLVLGFRGIDESGLLSVAYKAPQILMVIVGVLNQSWYLAVVQDFDRTDADGFLIRVFDIVEFLMAIATAVLVAASPLIARVLFMGDFYEAWTLIPFLMLSAFITCLEMMWSPIFAAVYDSRSVAAATLTAGLACVVVGAPLTCVFGAQGAAFAAALSGAINWLYRGLVVRRHVDRSFHLGRTGLLFGIILAESFLVISGLPQAIRIVGSLGAVALVLLLCRARIASAWEFCREAIRTRRIR